MAAAGALTRDEFARLSARVEGRIAKRLIRALEKAKQGVRLTDLERAILDRNYAAAVAAIGRERVLNALVAAQTDAAPLKDKGWEQIAKTLPERLRQKPVVELTLGAYATQRPEVLDHVQRADLRRIREIDRETENAIRDAITRALNEGMNPREAARHLRATLGLNRRQAASVDAYRQRLMREGRDPDQVERMVERLAARHAQSRAENIARTEVMTALNTGRRLQIERLAEDGVIQRQEWEQEWVVADDERTCPRCIPFDGQRADIGQSFQSQALETAQQPPLHPRCRCVIRLVLRDFREGRSTKRQLRLEGHVPPGSPLAPRPTRPTAPPPPQPTGSMVSEARETAAEQQRRVEFEQQARTREIELGYSRLADGGERQYQGTRDQIRFTDQQLAEIQDAPFFTHNHPNASAFSKEDVLFAAAHRVRTFRAVGVGPDGPVSYETDVGSIAGPRRLNIAGIEQAFDRIKPVLREKYYASYQARRLAGMPEQQAADATTYEMSHEIWEILAQHFGFRYTRRLG